MPQASGLRNYFIQHSSLCPKPSQLREKFWKTNFSTMPQAPGLGFFFGKKFYPLCPRLLHLLFLNSFLHMCLVPWTWKIFLIKIFSTMPQTPGLRKFSFKKNFIHYASGPWTWKNFWAKNVFTLPHDVLGIFTSLFSQKETPLLT